MSGSSPLSEMLSTLAARSNAVRVRSALNPILWLSGVFCLPSVGGAVLSEDPIVRYVCLGVFVLTLFSAMGVAIYFALAKPNLLQSEEFQLRHEVIQILARRGAPPEVLSPLAAPIPDPQHPLPKPEGDAR